MKTIGMIGGMSWESTVTYYQVINQTVKEKLGGLHSARCVLYSVDFEEIEKHQTSGRWDLGAEVLSNAGRAVERAGAECVVICTNTMHKVADEVQAAVTIPLLHIAEMTADELERHDIRRVGLLGTRYTMEDDFYTGRLTARSIEPIVPDAEGRSRVNDIIFRELCLGEIKPESKRFLIEQVEKLSAAGAQGVILGCTELGLLLKQEDTKAPLFDTALIHARGAALFALQ